MVEIMKRPNKKDYFNNNSFKTKEDRLSEYQIDLEKYADYAEDVLEARKDKEFMIRMIEKQIKDEYRKYMKLEKWETVAAVKIYNTLFPNNKESRSILELLQLTPDQVEDYLKNI